MLASRVAAVRGMVSALDIIEAANIHNFKLEDVAEAYFAVGEHVELGWFRSTINSQVVDNRWEALAKEACRDDLDWQQRGLAVAVLTANASQKTLQKKIEQWSVTHKSLIERWKLMLSSLRSNSSLNFIMFNVAVRELMDLTQASRYTADEAIKSANKTKKKPEKKKLIKVQKLNKTGTEDH